MKRRNINGKIIQWICRKFLAILCKKIFYKNIESPPILCYSNEISETGTVVNFKYFFVRILYLIWVMDESFQDSQKAKTVNG